MQIAAISDALVNAAAAAGSVSIPNTGIDMAGYIEASVLVLGGIVAAAVGGFFAFWAIKKGMSWASKAG